MNELSTSLLFFLQKILPGELSPASLVLFFLASTIILSLLLVTILIYVANVRAHQQQAAAALKSARKEQENSIRKLNSQAIKEARLTTLLTNERKHSAEKLQLLEDAREELALQFSSLAQRIFDEKSDRFSELNREKLETILQPFNAQLTAFKQEINQLYLADSSERISLKSEIVQLKELNQQINQEAINLTKALKGDTKLQGNWGELVLERVLEHSGLRAGHEYETQGGFRDNENRLLKPDVIIHLPEDKDIIIDSKVSLRSWEKYINSESDEEARQHLQELVKAIREHISGLSSKNYPELAGIHSLDFVLLFMPIEAAFSTVFAADEKLFGEALAKNIIIVTPTTLLATLRTVENIWQFEHQSKNSLEIARRAGIMYDKFRGFVEDMDKMGKQLATCHSTYESGLSKLTRGRGNLISQAEQLRELGVQVKKELPRAVTERADLELKN